MQKGDLAVDPRGLIYESYRIDGITEPECRSIFLDWALGVPMNLDTSEVIKDVLAHYQAANPAHPMTKVLLEGLQRLSGPPRRRGRADRFRPAD